MVSSPYVSLTVSDLDPRHIAQLTQHSLGDPQETIFNALLSYRLLVINHAKTEIAKRAEVTGYQLLEIVDAAAGLYLKRFNRIVGPIALSQYVKAYENAQAGDVPTQVLYALADQHADRLGTYFNETSREALLEGFNAQVNRMAPARLAADRVLDAYGLTPRQMRGLVALEPQGKVTTTLPRLLKQKTRDYISRSIQQRLKIFAKQEVHNLDQQAMQTAWLWMQDKGKISPNAQKVWLTAKDERVCKECGPMHGKKVDLGDKFKMPSGVELFVPGAHTNCRCEVKLQNPIYAVEKSLSGGERQEFNREHPRGRGGRFTVKERTDTSPVIRTGFDEFLEEAVRRGQEIKEAEEKPKAKFETPTATFSATQGTFKPISEAKFSAPAQFGAPTEKATFGAEEKAHFIAPKRPKFKFSSAQNRAMFDDTREVLANLLPPMPRRTTKYRPTIKIDGPDAAGIPVYSVVEPYEIGNSDRVDIVHDREFTTSMDDVVDYAQQLFEMSIDDGIDHVIEYQDGRITKTQQLGSSVARPLSVKLHADVSQEDISDIVTTVAYQGGADNDWYGQKATFSVDWKDDDGHKIYSEQLPYSYAIEQWGLSPEDFEVGIYRLAEGHDSSLGTTYEDTHDTQYGYSVWRTSGRYWVEESNKIQVGYSIPIRVYDLLPVVDTETIDEHGE